MAPTTSAPSYIQPLTFVALRLPSGTHKITRIVPDTTISVGKYGSFHANSLLGRPYYLTFEILDKIPEDSFAQLRVVPASEIHAEAITDEPSASESRDELTDEPTDGVTQADLVGDDAQILLRNNRLTVDDPTRQALSMDEIEELKKTATSSGRDIIAKIMQSHAALEEKTAFSLAKYTLRKSKKYMRRFTVLPVDVSTLMHWMLHEKEASRILELREEVLGLVTAWSNVHFGMSIPLLTPQNASEGSGHGRWLVVDDTTGLLVAAMAEKMGILYPDLAQETEQSLDNDHVQGEHVEKDAEEGADTTHLDTEPTGENKIQSVNSHTTTTSTTTPRKHRRQPPDLMSANDNTITLIHPASQPNVSMLSYFSYDPTEITQSGPIPSTSHPLHTHLKTVSWLQLISPELDNAYLEPEVVSEETLASWKAGKRGTYYRKRRRWERTKRVVDETRLGGFDGLVVASATSATSILHHLVPLLRGGAQVVVYSASIEPLAELVDAYSSARRSALLQVTDEGADDDMDPLSKLSKDNFPLDPRLLLGTNLQTVRAREWQVLPGRTHPLMTSRGGAEGYIFTGTRVTPVAGRVAARGTYSKKRKIAETSEGPAQEISKHQPNVVEGSVSAPDLISGAHA